MKLTRKLAALLLALCLLAGLCACGDTARNVAAALEQVTDALEDLEENREGFNAAFEAFAEQIGPEEDGEEATLDPEGSYTSKEDVALYLHTYGKLPGNFMTKKEARALGWSGGGQIGRAHV